MELFKSPLGELKVKEMLLYYDRPFIFYCEDDVGTCYIAHLVDDDENGECWFLVPSSRLRVEHLRCGKITLRQSILNAEPGWIWQITTPYDGSEGLLEKRECKNLDERDLPAEDTALSFPERTLPDLQIHPEQEAKQTMRNVLLLSLDDGTHSHSICTSYLGAVLLRTQGLINSLAHREGSGRGRIPQSVLQETCFNFVGSFAASVGIKLESSHSKLFEPAIEEALEMMLKLLSLGAEKEALSNLLPMIPKRSIARYRFLLQSLEQAKVSFRADWGSPHKGYQTAMLSRTDIVKIIDILELEGEDTTQTITLTGDLIGLLSDKKKKRSSFEFVAYGGERYKGTLASDLIMKEDWSSKIPAYNVTVIIEETLEINPATSEERISYTLLEIASEKN